MSVSTQFARPDAIFIADAALASNSDNVLTFFIIVGGLQQYSDWTHSPLESTPLLVCRRFVDY